MLTTKMRDDWARALTSGKFKQCYGMIASHEGGHCCLGVAYVTWTGKPVPLLNRDDAYAFVTRAIGERMSLLFMEMNDKQHKSFAQIAIEVRGLRAVGGE